MSSTTKSMPAIVSHVEWQSAHDALLLKEKELTHARDALAAERRRLPMERIDQQYVFDGEDGTVSLLDLFAGRQQLLLYHFMFAPGVMGWPSAGCPGCSLFVDNIGQYALTHVSQRDVSFAVVSRAPIANIAAYRERMQWPHRWVSSANTSFNDDFGLSTPQGEMHGLSVFLRDGANIFRTYFTSMRGLEAAGTVWMLLDLTPFGRQETWEDSPPNWPQTEPYEWWNRHDEYGAPA